MNERNKIPYFPDEVVSLDKSCIRMRLNDIFDKDHARVYDTLVEGSFLAMQEAEQFYYKAGYLHAFIESVEGIDSFFNTLSMQMKSAEDIQLIEDSHDACTSYLDDLKDYYEEKFARD